MLPKRKQTFDLRLTLCYRSTRLPCIDSLQERESLCFTEKRAEGKINQMVPVLAQLVTGAGWVSPALLVVVRVPTPSYLPGSSRRTVQQNDRLL